MLNCLCASDNMHPFTSHLALESKKKYKGYSKVIPFNLAGSLPCGTTLPHVLQGEGCSAFGVNEKLLAHYYIFIYTVP